MRQIRNTREYRTWCWPVGIRWLVVTGLIAAVGMGGCAGDSPPAKPTTGRDPTLAEVPSADETVRGDEDPPIVTLEIGTALHEHKLIAGEKLPGNIVIPTTNLQAVPVTAALQGVLSGTDVSLSWDASTFNDHLVTVMNLSGPLPQVVDKICASARVFCSFRNGSLELRDKETFIISLPPIAHAVASTSTVSNNTTSSSGSSGSNSSSGSSGSTSSAGSSSIVGAAGNTMADTISELAEDKVKIDDQGGNIIYTTSVDGENRVREYLEQLRNGRPLVVLQLYIWEVTLKKENSEGINWNSLKFPTLGGHLEDLSLTAPASTFTAITSGATFGAVTAGKISASLLLSFLSTQGQVQTISNPQVTFVSGSGAEFKVGGKTNYISQVGQLVTASNVSGTSSSNSSSGVGTNTVATDSINTGLSINVNGAYEGGVVFATLDLSLTNLVSLNPTNAGGGSTDANGNAVGGGEIIDLPETTDRQISTVIRVRPGDNLVMAGMVTSQDTNNKQGIPLPGDGRLPMYGDTQYQNNELVIMVKPSVVLFSDKATIEEARKKEQTQPLPDALVIDKDGAKTFAMPDPAKPQPPLTSSLSIPEPAAPSKPPAAPVPQPTAMTTPAVSTPKPELMISDPVAQPIPITPETPPADDSNALVDRHLMQRGFSHAFDELLQPATSMPQSAADAPAGGGDRP